MTNPVTCSKCNIFLGNLYFLNSKISSSNTISFRKNKVYYIADDKSQYAYAYCQKCWPTYVLSNNVIKQKVDPIIDANYTLYINEYGENIHNKKELGKLIGELSHVKEQLVREEENNNILVTKYVSEISLLKEHIEKLEQENSLCKDKMNLCYFNIESIQNDFDVITEENKHLVNDLGLCKFNNEALQNDLNERVQKNNILTDKLNLCKFNNETLQNDYDEMAEQMDNYENYIDNMETMLLDKTSIIKLLNTDNKIIRKELNNNKTMLHKLKIYSNDLNDFVEENMITKEQLQNTQVHLHDSLVEKYHLADEINELNDELKTYREESKLLHKMSGSDELWDANFEEWYNKQLTRWTNDNELKAELKDYGNNFVDDESDDEQYTQTTNKCNDDDRQCTWTEFLYTEEENDDEYQVKYRPIVNSDEDYQWTSTSVELDNSATCAHEGRDMRDSYHYEYDMIIDYDKLSTRDINEFAKKYVIVEDFI